ncbi:AEC family transporter [Sutterella sp.]|uniref:AEC family transporter n=1 Tax=Sutterella sp. TaxID=1981025 RepID=UPI0026DFFF47|nr:hypothetical protein [Sutterella sp.]MDO5531952.1 hypothetical protein [Sutterella sp.]
MNALLSVLAYVIIIVMGVLLKQFKLVPSDLSRPVGFLILNITLPCAIVTFLTGVTLPLSLLLTILIPFLTTWLMIGVAWLLNFRRPDAEKAVPFAMLNMSSYNVGTFAMPFTAGLVSPMGFLAVCLFDVGNSVMCTGGTYAFICRGKGSAKDTLVNVARTLSHSIPLWTYMIVIALSFTTITIPKPVLHIFEVIGNANSFLSMLFIGLSINLSINWSRFGNLLWLMVVRYVVNAVIAAALYFWLPFPLEIRQSVVLALMAPLPVMGIIFSMKAKLNWEDAANINSVSVIVSIVIMCTLLSVFTS